jgi:hypothetical protein
MKKLIVMAALLFASEAAAVAQTSKFGIPATSGAGGVQLTVSTVAQLPVCDISHQGMLRAVNDASSPTFAGTLTGGGTVKVIAFCNGTAWVAH